MAIFNNGDSTSGTTGNSNTTIITTGAKFKGELNLTCNLYIDGEIDGTIHSSKEVNIGKNGHVEGSVIAQKLIVQGSLSGSIDANRVDIKAGGHVKGEIVSVELVIESKGIFEGNSIIKDTSKNVKEKQ